MAGAAPDTEPADDRENEVLRRDARARRSRHVDCERARPALQQALGRQHVPDLGGADPESQRPEGAVGARVAVAAHDRHARLREPELGPDDVHDAALAVGEAEQLDAEPGAVDFELLDLSPGGFERDRQAAEHLAREGRRRMVHGRERALGPPHPQAPLAQQRERLRRSDLVDEVQVDIEQRGRVGGLGAHHVTLPHLVEEGLGRARHP